MDVDAAQAGSYSGSASLGQQNRVGGERQVLDARNRDQFPNQYRQIAAHQRLAAGDAQLA